MTVLKNTAQKNSNAYYLAESKEYTAFQTRREYVLSRLVKKIPLFDGLKYCVFFTSVPLVSIACKPRLKPRPYTVQKASHQPAQINTDEIMANKMGAAQLLGAAKD